MDELPLIRAAQGGDAQSFERLVNYHYSTIFRFAYRWCGNPTDAEDITQQACIKLARSINQFRFEAAFTSWLYRLVINCAKDWHQSQQRHQGDELPLEEAGEQPKPGETEIYLHQVLRQLDRQGENFKETALLVYAEGLTHAEAALILEVKESTISWRLHEIRKQLQQLQQAQPGSWEIHP